MESNRTPSTINDSFASNPANMSFNPLLWVCCYTKWPLIWLIGFVLFSTLSMLSCWGYAVPASFFALANFLYWRQVKARYKFGCVLPAVIVSSNPLLLAIYTDLSKGIGSYPAIRIQPLNILSPKLYGVGRKLPVAALYSDGRDVSSPLWESFDPRPIGCATTNQAYIEKKLQSIPGEGWVALCENIKKIPSPYKSGLYYINNLNKLGVFNIPEAKVADVAHLLTEDSQECIVDNKPW